MKKLKIGLIAIALLIGGVQAYGGLRFTTYYCSPDTVIESTNYRVATSSPSLSCVGSQNFTFVCTFSAGSGYTAGQLVPSGAAFVLSTYDN